ncbi:MAG: NAD(P)-dependent oxidoreductase [Chitinophagales bacterium]
MIKKVLIADNVHKVMLENFEKAGFTCVLKPDITQAEVDSEIESYFGIIINSKTKMFTDTINKAKKLKFIGRLGSGMEIIDVPHAKQKAIECFSVPEGNKDAVAEHAIAMLLSLFNNLNRADKEVRNFIWEREKNRGIELGAKTIAIIGYGNTGKAISKKLSGFGVKILAYDKYLENYSDEYVTETDMKTIFEKADVVSFHIPLTKETKYLCNKDFVNNFKKQIFIINTSRGAIVNLEEIYFQFISKKILGACLDVFENEKPEHFNILEKKMYQRLYQLDSVILSPHIAGWTNESKFKIGNLLSTKIIKSITKKT